MLLLLEILIEWLLLYYFLIISCMNALAHESILILKQNYFVCRTTDISNTKVSKNENILMHLQHSESSWPAVLASFVQYLMDRQVRRLP